MTYEWHEHDTKKINLIDSVWACNIIGVVSTWDALFMHVRNATGRVEVNQLSELKLMVIGKHDKKTMTR
jgi:hypothetical protein